VCSSDLTIAGRTFSETDLAATATAMTKVRTAGMDFAANKPKDMKIELNTVINQAMARKVWPDQNPIGKTLKFGLITYRVVGIVGDTKPFRLEGRPMSQVYFGLPFILGDQPQQLSVMVQGMGEPTRLAGTLRSTVLALDSSLAVFKVATVPDMIATSMNATTFQTFLLVLFAGLALLLASVGIYGVLAYVVKQRMNEIGIRMALGASRGNVLWMVMRHGLVLTVIGIAAGLAGTFAAVNLLSNLLYGVKSTDPATFVAVSTVLGVVAMTACMVPAFRATRVDPILALRYE
jgi:putative ABC transport system permease protein